MVFWFLACGPMCVCKMMKERTEGWLVVRIGQVSKVELTVPP